MVVDSENITMCVRSPFQIDSFVVLRYLYWESLERIDKSDWGFRIVVAMWGVTGLRCQSKQNIRQHETSVHVGDEKFWGKNQNMWWSITIYGRRGQWRSWKKKVSGCWFFPFHHPLGPRLQVITTSILSSGFLLTPISVEIIKLSHSTVTGDICCCSLLSYFCCSEPFMLFRTL